MPIYICINLGYNLSMSAITARQKILALIGRRESASTSQIGRSLSMSPAAVRHHLSILRRDGRIVQERPEPKRARGRPEKVYRLSDRLLGENLAGLSDSLLNVWQENLPAASQAAALHVLGEALARQAGGLAPGLSATRRLVQLAEKLNSLGYQAHWEAGARGPRIFLGHCPYAAIISGHPELCAVDAAFLGSLVEAPLEQITKMGPKPGDATHCIFAMPEAAHHQG